MAALVMAAALIVPTGPRASAFECPFDDYTRQLTVTLAPDEEVTLSVGVGDRILVDGRDCASITDVQRVPPIVRVPEGSFGDETVMVSQAGPGGSFPQGFSIEVNLGEGASDRVAVVGSDSPETFGFNGSGMFGSLDIYQIGVERFELEAGGGDDRVDASGTDVDTGSFDLPLRIRGGPGDDTLIGGPRDDRILGDEGNDTLDGGPGIDRLHGGDGSDVCVLDVPAPCDPSITVDPATVPAGGSLTLSGDGWYPENGGVELSFVPTDGGAPQRLTTLTPDEGWTIRTTLDAPSPDGTYSVIACQPCSEQDAERSTKTFTVQPATAGPTVSILPTTVAAGEDLVVSGERWDPAEGPIGLFAEPELPDVPAGEPFATVLADADGRFEQRFPAPELEEGRYTVTACQRCGAPDEIRDATSFTVASRPAQPAMLELQPTQGSPGDPIRLVGLGWEPDAGSVRIFVDPSATTDGPDAVVQVRPDGTFARELDVPDLPEGAYEVRACQRCNGVDPIQDTATFAVSTGAPARWWWVVLGSAALIAAIAALMARRIRARRPPPPGQIHVSLRPDEPEVHVVAEPDGSPRHTVRLIPRTDPGVQRIREGSPR